jgi:hypothetical protein
VIVSSFLLNKYQRWDAGFFLGDYTSKKTQAEALEVRKKKLLVATARLQRAREKQVADRNTITARQKEWIDKGLIHYLPEEK